MRKNGIYSAPSQFVGLLISTAHDAEHIEATIKAVEKIFNYTQRHNSLATLMGELLTLNQ
jgi:glutamate-1-semialdehyde aminotransferase